MRHNFPAILKLSTRNEGGYSNHPRDPGGPTNHGITQGTLSSFIGRSASIADVKALSIETANKIYAANYWDTVGGDDLPSGLDYAMFDFGINSGPSRANKELQKLLPGVAVDGLIGKKTIAALAGLDIAALIRKLCVARIAFCRQLKTWPSFGRGWTYRVMGTDPDGKYKRKPGVIGDSIAMFERGKIILSKLPDEMNVGKARDVDVKILAPERNKLQAGVIGSTVAAGAVELATNYLPTFTEIAGTLAPYKDEFKYIGIAFIVVSVLCAVATIIINTDKIRGAGSHA